MCNNHDHGNHDHGRDASTRTDGGSEKSSQRTDDHPAVVHPDIPSSVYSGGYTYVRELEAMRYDYREVWEELRDPKNRVIEGSEIPFTAHGGESVPGTQMWNKYLMNPRMGLTQSLTMHTEILAPQGKSQDHYHQNEAYMYILEGEGYEIHDGVEYQWEAGDLAVIHSGCVHQHFSDDPDNPCKVLIVKPKALYQFLHLLYQGYLEPEPTEPAEDPDWVPPELYYDDEGNVVDNRHAHPRREDRP